MNVPRLKQYRILVADDEESYLDLYNEVINLNRSRTSFELVCCKQGDEAIYQVKKSIKDNNPFSVAFVDVRMHPGPDGMQVAKEIRGLDPHVEIAIVTGYSDYTPNDFITQVPPIHKIVYIQKPFHLQEIYHFSHALSAKWEQELNLLNVNEKLEEQVEERTKKYHETNEFLIQKTYEHKRAEAALNESEERYRQLFDNESDAVMIFDGETEILEDANPAALKLFGYSKNEFMGLRVKDIATENDKTRLVETKANTGGLERKNVYIGHFQKKNGVIFPGEIYTGKFISIGRKKIIGAVRDITERMRSEEKLRFLSSSLLTAQEKERK